MNEAMWQAALGKLLASLEHNGKSTNAITLRLSQDGNSVDAVCIVRQVYAETARSDEVKAY